MASTSASDAGSAALIPAVEIILGSHVGQVLRAFGVARPKEGAALPALVAQRAAEVAEAKEETLREKQSRARAREAACKADAAQLLLF